MAARGLRFVGQLPLYLCDRDLTIPDAAAAFFRGVTDRAEFERLKDYAVNEFFRADVYTKDAAPPDPSRATAWLDATPFGTLVPEDAVKREIRLRHHTLRYEGPLFAALVARLARAPATVGELARDPSFARHGVDAIRDAVRRLLFGEQVMPMRSSPAPVPADYNRVIVEQRLSTKSPVVLASPVAGTGIVVPTLHAVALRLLRGVLPTEHDAWIRAFVARQPVTLHAAGRPVVDPAEQARIIAQEVEKFRARRLPKLVALGVVE
jgi:hypothetical protein